MALMEREREICRQFGRRLVRLREKHGLTQEALAEKAGISTKYLQNLEGKRPKKATIVSLYKLANGFGMALWKLLKF